LDFSRELHERSYRIERETMLQIGFDVGGRKIAVGVVDESKQIVALI
jgi:hypothetical protein